jgi:hypothetical protein
MFLKIAQLFRSLVAELLTASQGELSFTKLISSVASTIIVSVRSSASPCSVFFLFLYIVVTVTVIVSSTGANFLL